MGRFFVRGRRRGFEPASFGARWAPKNPSALARVTLWWHDPGRSATRRGGRRALSQATRRIPSSPPECDGAPAMGRFFVRGRRGGFEPGRAGTLFGLVPPGGAWLERYSVWYRPAGPGWNAIRFGTARRGLAGTQFGLVPPSRCWNSGTKRNSVPDGPDYVVRNAIAFSGSPATRYETE